MEFINIYQLCTFALLFAICSAKTNDSKYSQVKKTKEQNHAGSVLRTTYWISRLECATTCDSISCVSFSYNAETQECKTYGEQICYWEDGATSSVVKYYTKTLGALSSCADVPAVYCSGVYSLLTFDVYCDMDTSGGPWTVIANRFDGSVDFYRSWIDYKVGFGNLTGEFWMGDIMTGATCGTGDANSSGTPDLAFGFCEGFENLRTLLTPTPKLRIVMVGWDNSRKQADYSSFSVGSEEQKYFLTANGFSSPDGLVNCLSYHNGRPFSTPDEDNDSYSGSCPEAAHGSWWYGYCLDSNLFGDNVAYPSYSGMVWEFFYADGERYSTVNKAKLMITKSPT